tara:strand:- start:5000 stop:6658 length:1659 start_codon:yes stop_codon:yes gene_type:complete
MTIIDRIKVPFFLIIVALASVIGINQYHFGMWNQFISLPWLYELIDPANYPHDLLVEQYSNSPTFFLFLLKWALPFFGENVPLLFFSFYLICLALTIYSFYRLGQEIFKSKEAGVLAVVLLSFAFPVIGDVSIWDTLLMERTITYPILLLSILHLYKGRLWYAILLLGLAFNIHPLSAIYVIAASALAVLLTEGFKKEYIWQGFFLLLMVSPVLLLKFSNTAPGESSLSFSETWMEVMRLRNGHHTFPSEFPPSIFLKTALIILSYYVILAKGNFAPKAKVFLHAFGGSILFMMLLGTVFTEFFPVKLIIQFQFYRAFLFMGTLSLILWAGMLVKNPKPVFYLLAIPFLAQYAYGEWAKTISALSLIGLAWFVIRYFGFKRKASLGLSFAYLSLGLIAMLMRGGLEIHQGNQENDWYEVQDWFRENTAQDALAIVPPAELGFRVRSLRTSYGDWFDGTKAFFSEQYAEYWYDHMSRLKCTDPDHLKEDYSTLQSQDFLNIWDRESDKHSEAYVVHYADRSVDKLPVAYLNEHYVVYQLPTKETPVFLASVGN